MNSSSQFFLSHTLSRPLPNALVSCVPNCSRGMAFTLAFESWKEHNVYKKYMRNLFFPV